MSKTSTTLFTFVAGALAGVAAGAFLSLDKLKKSGNDLVKELSTKKKRNNKSFDSEEDIYTDY